MAYFRSSLTSRRNYCVTRKELLAVVKSVKRCAWRRCQILSDLALIVKLNESTKGRPARPDISSESAAVKIWWRQWERLEVRNSVLYRRESDRRDSTQWQLVLPKSFRAEVRLLKHLHDHKSAGQLGVLKKSERLKQHFYWYGYTSDLKDWLPEVRPLCGSEKAKKDSSCCPETLHCWCTDWESRDI